mgnify:CR=1 FL=1
MNADPVLWGTHPERGLVRSVWHKQVGWRWVTVVERRLRGASQGTLVHLAFLTTLRQQLGAPLEAWEISKTYGNAIPDALWHRPEGVWAVEVDLGYPRALVVRKVHHFTRYAGQVWGVVSRERERQVWLEVRRITSDQPLKVLTLVPQEEVVA